MRPLLLTVVLFAHAVAAAEVGHPLITLFRQEQHHGGTQNFDVARDPRGRMIFTNLDGILIYDGAWWTKIDVPGGTAFEAAPDAQGRIGVSALEDFGVLVESPTGSLTYRSLIPLLPADLRGGIGQASVCALGDRLFFVAPHFAAEWNGSSLRIIEREPSAPRARRCSVVGGRLFFPSFAGLEEFGGPMRFAGRRVDVALPAFVILRNEGIFGYDEKPIANEASRWLRGKGVMAAKTLRDGRIAVATLRYGLLVMKPDGRIDQIIDAASGLPDVYLFGVEQDTEGALWLAMDTAAVRIDFDAAVSVFDQRVGLLGTAQTMARHAGKMHVGTPSGIFVLEPAGNGMRARRLPGMDGNNPWAMLSVGRDLLVGTYGGVFVVRDGAPARLIAGTDDQTTFALARSERDPSLVYLGMDEGLAKLRLHGDAWRFEGMVAGSVPHVRSIVDTPNALWYGSAGSGAVRMGHDGTFSRYTEEDVHVMSVAGRVVLVTNDGFFQPGPRGTLVPDPLLGHIHSTGPVMYSARDARDNVWISTRPPRVVRRHANGKFESEAYAVGAIDGDAQTFYADDDGVMWIGSERGVYRVAPEILASTQKQPAPAIRRVVDREDRVLYDGLGSTSSYASLPHGYGRVRIEVAPFSWRSQILYQYRLDPIDSDWSPWSEQAFLDYTNLGPDDYTFRVRTRGAAGAMSDEARWTFNVRPPWYATPWTIGLWSMLALLLVAAIIRIRTGTLRGRARELQQRVEEQTVMLREANERLERLSLIDPLTGLANRRAFDRALAETWKRAERHDEPLSIVMLDLDHFKRLNDTHGHAAGDECLRRAAEHLANAVRGNGDDVVARWGGEEFVLLLSADEATAAEIAERIRIALESLGTPASFGIAARAGEPNPEHVVRRADRALYEAKMAGRNRVVVFTEPSHSRTGNA